MNDIVTQLADKDAIRTLIYTYCRSVDRCDVPLGHAVWHEDGVADYGADYYQGPGKGVIDKICANHLHLLSHSHQVSNVLIELHGEKAGSESYVTGTMRMDRDGRRMAMEVIGRYLDKWEKRDGRWGLVYRGVVFDHATIREDMPLPGHGLPSARDLTDPSYAVLKG